MKNRWSLVVHEVSESSVTLWVGTLFNDLRKPATLTVSIQNEQLEIAKQTVNKADWQRPFREIRHQRFFQLLTFDQLNSGSDYKITVAVCLEVDDDPVIVTSGSFTTLPKALNDLANGFTLAFGSCFYEEFDGGKAGLAYETLTKATEFPYKPHISFLTGDQVYLDIGWDSLSLKPKEIRERVANDYALHWQALRRILRNGATWFLSDDHEFWNNYPLVEGPSPFIQALRIKSVKDAWLHAAKDGVNRIQRIKPIKTFTIGNDLAFCLVDLRAYRNKRNIITNKTLNELLQWLEQLTSPAVLALSQPMMEAVDEGDRNFPFYQAQYQKIVRAIHNAKHDVMVLSGDVHHGRISSVQFAGRNNKLVEVVSSPISNLSGFSSIATSTISKNDRVTNFPPMQIADVPEQKISYKHPWKVSESSELLDLRYLKARTNEHFMTINFNKLPSGGISADIRAWLVRKRDKSTGLPKQDWQGKAVNFELN